MIENLKIIFDKYKSQKFFQILNYILLILSVYYLWDKLQEFEYNNIYLIPNFAFLFCVFLTLISFLFQAIGWAKLFDSKINNYFIKVWLNSNISKYIPLKIGVIIKRVNDIKLKYKHISGKLITKNYLYEQFFILITAILISLGYFVKNIFLFTLIILIGVIILEILNRSARNLKNLSSLSIFLISQLFFLYSLYIISFNVFGSTSLKFASIYLISTIIGMFVFTAPTGIGVRESVFMFLLGDSYGLNAVISYIIICRILISLADVLTFLLSFLIPKK